MSIIEALFVVGLIAPVVAVLVAGILALAVPTKRQKQDPSASVEVHAR